MSSASSIRLLRGAEAAEYEQLTGTKYLKLFDGDTPSITQVMAFVWIVDRRNEPSLTFDDVGNRFEGELMDRFAEIAAAVKVSNDPEESSGESNGSVSSLN